MTLWGALSIATSVIALILSILFHLFKTTWWMATLSVSLNNLSSSIEDVKKVMARYESIRYTTEDAARDFALRDKQLETIWKRIDELKDKKGA